MKFWKRIKTNYMYEPFHNNLPRVTEAARGGLERVLRGRGSRVVISFLEHICIGINSLEFTDERLYMFILVMTLRY